MMVLIGYGQRIKDDIWMGNDICPACGQRTQFRLKRLQQRATVFYIPVMSVTQKRMLVCDRCGACIAACPGNAIDADGLDTWQCSVYYKGAHKSNPFQTEDFLKDHPRREQILNGEERFDAASARQLYPKLNFLPNTQWGYAPCLCGRKCDIACYEHLVGEL